MIERYGFGHLVYDGKIYSSDLIIFPDHIRAGWRRREGHRLQLADIEAVTSEPPEVFLIGTGYFGRMKVDPEVTQYFQQITTRLVIARSRRAVKEFNRISLLNKTAAAFHLTC